VFLRALALLSAVAVPLLLAAEGISGLHPAMFWLGPLAAIAAALPIVLAAKQTRTQALFGAALAAMAAASTPGLPQLLRITGSDDALPVHDLREGLLPETKAGYAAVRGYLQPEWVVDEYAVAEGARPDQNQAPKAVLLPLLGSDQEVTAVSAGGRVVIARVNPERVKPTLVTLRGRLVPAEREIVESLFLIQRQDGASDQPAAEQIAAAPPAVMLDTFDMPTRGQALTRLGLALGASALALVLLLLAIPRASQTEAKQPRASARAQTHEERKSSLELERAG